MFSVIRMITLPPARVDQRDEIAARLQKAASSLTDVVSSWAAPLMDQVSINAGHIVWRMEFRTEAQALKVHLDPHWPDRIAPELEGAAVSTVGYRPHRLSVGKPGSGVWRALIFRVMPQGFPDGAAELEKQTLMMPKYMKAIRNWALSNVSYVEGPKAFTHVWEQEYDDVSGLTGEYMTHPLHWGVVDSWFDAECPNYIVDPLMVQVVGGIDETIMG